MGQSHQFHVIMEYKSDTLSEQCVEWVIYINLTLSWDINLPPPLNKLLTGLFTSKRSAAEKREACSDVPSTAKIPKRLFRLWHMMFPHVSSIIARLSSVWRFFWGVCYRYCPMLKCLDLGQPGLDTLTGWWFGCHFWHFTIYWVSNHPNWLSFFFRGVAQPPTRIYKIL